MSDQRATSAVADLCRMICGFRLAVIFLTIAYAFVGVPGISPLLVAAILLSMAASYLPMRRWPHLEALLVHHPALLVLDILLATYLLATAGPNTPFAYYGVGTLLLAGLLYGMQGAIVFTALQLGTYAWALRLHSAVHPQPYIFLTVAGIPGLYLLAAAGGFGLQRLLDRYAQANRQVAEIGERLSATEERARLARDMHDSLGKTIAGIVLAADALARAARPCPPPIAQDASRLADAAHQAAHEARRLLSGLRSEPLDEPLSDAVHRIVAKWTGQAGAASTVQVEDGMDPDLDLEVRHQLLLILDEALANVAWHADADHVKVGLTRDGHLLDLSVSDNGTGLDDRLPLEERRLRGNYGLLGMQERAAQVGGTLSVRNGQRGGTEVRARLPCASTAGPVTLATHIQPPRPTPSSSRSDPQ